jgi:hypothetical protein
VGHERFSSIGKRDNDNQVSNGANGRGGDFIPPIRLTIVKNCFSMSRRAEVWFAASGARGRAPDTGVDASVPNQGLEMLAVNGNLLGSAPLLEQLQPDVLRRDAELPQFLAEP